MRPFLSHTADLYKGLLFLGGYFNASDPATIAALAPAPEPQPSADGVPFAGTGSATVSGHCACA